MKKPVLDNSRLTFPDEPTRQYYWRNLGVFAFVAFIGVLILILGVFTASAVIG